MPNELQKHVTRKAEEITGRQWCSHCQMTRPKEGGEWKILEGGKRRRWKCQSCVTAQKERAARIAGTSA